MVGWASFPTTLGCSSEPAMLLEPATGPQLGGMQIGSRPQNPGKEILNPDPWSLPLGCRERQRAGFLPITSELSSGLKFLYM